MILTDAIQSWPHLTWAGSFAGVNSLSVDPVTSIIKEVEIIKDKQEQKTVRIKVQKMDNNSALAVIPLRDITPPNDIVFDRVVKGLQSSIGKTLKETGKIDI